MSDEQLRAAAEAIVKHHDESVAADSYCSGSLALAKAYLAEPADQPAGAEASGCELPTRRLFLDCDGVLADFDAAFIAKFGHTPRDYEDRNGAEVFWRDIKAECPTFYRDLPLMPDAMELFEAVKHLRPIILTGVPRGEWAEMQKLAWAAEHFPGVPMVVCKARDKCLYLKPGDILIDDRTQYRERWEEAGGVFIHHTSAKDSLEALRGNWHPAPASELAELQTKYDKLYAACTRAEMSVMQTSGDWSLHDTSERGKELEKQTLDIVNKNCDLEVENAELRVERLRADAIDRDKAWQEKIATIVGNARKQVESLTETAERERDEKAEEISLLRTTLSKMAFPEPPTAARQE